MYYNMMSIIKILLIVFLFKNNTARGNLTELMSQFLLFLNDVFETQMGINYIKTKEEEEELDDQELDDQELDDDELDDDELEKDEKEEEKELEVKEEEKELEQVKELEVKEVEVVKEIIKFEDKYLKKFKEFKNEYSFTEEEQQLEKNKYDELLSEFNKLKTDGLKETTTKLNIIQSIFDKGGNNTIEGIEEITKYYNIEIEYDDEPEAYDLQELINELTEVKGELTLKIEELNNMVISETELIEKSKQYILDKKLDNFINNYVIDMTPMGNVYMRYNNNKKSFEYFSNNTIPYRYLEPVGRKYVITYFCKPLFIDIEEELKKAQQKKDDDKAKKDEEAKEKEDLILASGKTQSLNGKEKDIYTKMKSYNNESVSIAMMKGKNRQSNNTPLPPQIRANLPNVNASVAPDKMLLKEHANRYTWEGRTANLPIVKKVEKKHVDKNYEMSFADFKKMRQKQ